MKVRLMRARVLSAVMALALTLVACGDDDEAAMTINSDAEGIIGTDEDLEGDTDGATDTDPDEGGSDDPADGADASTPDTGRSIPANMPDGIPIPDDHVVLRAESTTSDDGGDFVGLNLAIGGTVDEQRVFYQAELEDAYGEVVVEGEITGEPFRFRGEWFELGRVYVTENEGFFDTDDIDTSGLPVIVTVQIQERETSG